MCQVEMVQLRLVEERLEQLRREGQLSAALQRCRRRRLQRRLAGALRALARRLDPLREESVGPSVPSAWRPTLGPRG